MKGPRVRERRETLEAMFIYVALLPIAAALIAALVAAVGSAG